MKNILITGCSSGFGRLTAETLIKRGYTVLATMIGLDTFSAKAASQLEDFAGKQSGTLHILELDVTCCNSIKSALKRGIELVDEIDVVINNAGIGDTGWTEAFSEEQTQKMFDVNVFGVQRMMRAVLPEMRKRNEGLIINFSSIQGRVVFPYSGIYSATKFAIEGLSESYHYELKPLGVDVVMLQPGGFKTNFEAIQNGPSDKARLDSYGELKDEPYKVWGNPDDTKDFLPHPQPIADAIIKLIETEPGKRPLRTLVDPLLDGTGTKTINEATQKAQRELSDKLGWDII
ncbi:Short-chain dehydrogenase [Mariniphaga anaerophila]|uniref:Short-chain dehydrogenase n=1 Tax=Mariniphaga anaerophila TaxID=1484053 RepID=A0A1M4U610_9BACT|nr:SDR family oxidoreductase [Mariniphaga anaerophila]SHE52169.1 Short-chain dehydrogenase [Mariniphaga anaerophila]